MSLQAAKTVSERFIGNCVFVMQEEGLPVDSTRLQNSQPVKYRLVPLQLALRIQHSSP